MPEVNEKYYFVNSEGGVDWHAWDNDKYDNFIIKNNKIFKTEAEAEDYLEYIKALNQHTYEFSVEEWKNEDIEKYSFYYDYEDNIIVKDTDEIVKYNKYYFKTEEQRDEFISKYEKQIKKYEYGIEED